MGKFKIEFTAKEVIAYSTIVEAETAKEALKKFQEEPSEYDWEEENGIQCEPDEHLAEVVGEYTTDEEDKRFSTLNKFEKPINYRDLKE